MEKKILPKHMLLTNFTYVLVLRAEWLIIPVMGPSGGASTSYIGYLGVPLWPLDQDPSTHIATVQGATPYVPSLGRCDCPPAWKSCPSLQLTVPVIIHLHCLAPCNTGIKGRCGQGTSVMITMYSTMSQNMCTDITQWWTTFQSYLKWSEWVIAGVRGYTKSISEIIYSINNDFKDENISIHASSSATGHN